MRIPLTLAEAKNLKPGMVLEYLAAQNADGTPQRFKVNGRVKTWFTMPDRVRIPVKRGLYEYGYVTEKNLSDFSLEQN